MDLVASALESAVHALIAGEDAVAYTILDRIDRASLVAQRAAERDRIWRPGGLASGYKSPLPGVKRQPTTRAVERATFARDNFTCRYAHCGRPTVSLDILKLFSTAFPALLPYRSNWKPLEDHILYWTYSTSLEHFTSFPSGGTSAADNLVTACYMCNDLKNHLPATLLEWSLLAPSDSKWLGLTQYASELRVSVAALRSTHGGAQRLLHQKGDL